MNVNLVYLAKIIVFTSFFVIPKVQSQGLNADKGCHDDEFQCASTRECIEVKYLCDGINDCIDGEDEKNCLTSSSPSHESSVSPTKVTETPPPQTAEVSSTPVAGCDYNQFQCPRTGECINAHYVCDGMNDCHHGEDEENCPTSSSQLHESSVSPTKIPETPQPQTAEVPSTPVTVTQFSFNGTCDPCNQHGTFTCTCDVGYTGDRCQYEIDSCKEPPFSHSNFKTMEEACSQNNFGYCNHTNDGAWCQCYDGWKGEFCQQNAFPPGMKCFLDEGEKCKSANMATRGPHMKLQHQYCIPYDLACFYLECTPPVIGHCIPMVELQYARLKEGAIEKTKRDLNH